MKTQTKLNYWQIIKECNWSNDHDSDRIKLELMDKYDSDSRSLLFYFVHRRQSELYVVFEDWAEKKTGRPHGYFGVTDDGMSDLTAHIVGLGKEEYNRVIKNPDLARKRGIKGDYHENFLYSFDFPEFN